MGPVFQLRASNKTSSDEFRLVMCLVIDSQLNTGHEHQAKVFPTVCGNIKILRSLSIFYH